ncbi:apolipoprotein N-acyltransferase [Hyphomonas sp.]|uniref:apolipoprotein N-acyltransferase n=1 Tax=Hyphomonas sp. TaxID=87 RepID=UPI0025C1C435|nr:apolipoprotein N-acyltransferase [Hyphomonas sp.]MBI1399930.1 apolipoprotein N-acyltransferase [Hyphomonas sp.]
MSTAVRSHGFTALGPLHESLARLTGWPAAGAAALFGALAAFAFAPFHFSAVLAVSFPALVWLIDGARAHKRWGRAVALRGWAFGSGFFLISMHWTAMPFLVNPAESLAFIWLPLIVLPAGMGLIWGACAAMAGAFWSASPSRIFVFALFFAIAEWIRGHLFGGFPWNLPGTTWIPGGALSQAASLGGVYWLTLITVFVMAAPAALVDTRDARGLGLRLAPSFGAVILLAFGWAWGAERTAERSPLTDQYVVVMDAGVPQAEWDRLPSGPVLGVYVSMLNYPDSKPGDIVVWPEGAVPGFLLQESASLDAISAYIGERTLIVGATRYEWFTDDTPVYYNSLAVLDANANKTGPISLYDKHRLVPFGELAAVDFIPFGREFAALLPPTTQRLAASGFRPGAGATAIDTGRIPPFVTLICYEGLFPEITRKANLIDRAQWIVLVSNDAWFGAGMGPAQHYAQNRYRAIETGLPLVRAANRGMSGIVDGYGRETMRTLPAETAPEGWSTTYGRDRIPEPAPPTVYQTRLGAGLFWFSLCLFALLAFLSWRR